MRLRWHNVLSILEDSKAEAAYFSADGGMRGCFVVVNMDDASQMLALAEPWFLAFNASVEVLPVMALEDLGKGGPGIEDAVKKHS
mgnify:FL=1